MQDAMMVAGTLKAAHEVGKMAFGAVKTAKKLYKKRKDRRTYKNNNYEEGK